MVKRVCAIVIAAIFLLTVFSMTAGAAQPFLGQKLLVQSIEGLQQKIDAGESSALGAVTIQFLDEILAAGLKNDKSALQLAVMRYVADIREIQAAEIDPATLCGISFAMSAGGAAVGMITEVTSGNSAICMVNNLSNKAADIAIANCKYNICLIDKTSSYTGTKTREEWVQQQKVLAIYNFTTSAVNVGACTPSPTVMTYFSLVMDLYGIFAAK